MALSAEVAEAGHGHFVSVLLLVALSYGRSELLSFEGFALWFHAAVGNHAIEPRWTATVQWCPFGEAVAGPPVFSSYFLACLMFWPVMVFSRSELCFCSVVAEKIWDSNLD